MDMFGISRVTSKGQVTIPIELRRELGIKEGDRILFTAGEHCIILEKITDEMWEERRKNYGLTE